MRFSNQILEALASRDQDCRIVQTIQGTEGLHLMCLSTAAPVSVRAHTTCCQHIDHEPLRETYLGTVLFIM